MPGPVPPYAPRDKPTSEIKKFTKSGMSTKRRAAGPIEFPWNRNIDFPAAQKAAWWNTGIYSQETLSAMEVIRSANAPYIDAVDL